MTAPDHQLLPPMTWNAWGDPDAAKPLSDGIRTLLEQALGVTADPGTELRADDVIVRPSALAEPDRTALAEQAKALGKSSYGAYLTRLLAERN